MSAQAVQCTTCAQYEAERPKFLRLTQLSRQAVRDYEDLRSCYDELKQHHQEQQCLAKKYRNENASLQLKVQEQQEVLNRLQNASEAVCEEYGMLRNQYDAEAKATSRVLKKATQWYMENQDLRRTSQMLWDKMTASGEDLTGVHPPAALSAASSTSSDLTSNGMATHDEGAVQLRQMVADLQLEVSCLKGELEKSESACRNQVVKNERILAALEAERAEHSQCRRRLAEMEDGVGCLNRVSVLAAREFFELRKKFEDESERNRARERETARLKGERNAAIRQSAFLVSQMVPEARLLSALDQIQALEMQAATTKAEHEAEVCALREQLSAARDESGETAEELKQCLAESEQKLFESQKRVQQLEERVRQLIEELHRETLAPPVVASIPPPPPPPPPPVPPPFNPLRSLMALIASSRKAAPQPTGGAKSREDQLQVKLMEEMIEQIKKGVHLRPTTRSAQEEEPDEKASSEPAVSEVLNILSDIKQRKTSRAGVRTCDSLDSLASSSSGSREEQSELERLFHSKNLRHRAEADSESLRSVKSLDVDAPDNSCLP